MFKIVAKNKWEKEQLEWAFDGWQEAVNALDAEEDKEDKESFGTVEWDGKILTADFEGFDDIQYRLDTQLRDMIYEQDIDVEKREFPKLNRLIEKMEMAIEEYENNNT